MRSNFKLCVLAAFNHGGTDNIICIVLEKVMKSKKSKRKMIIIIIIAVFIAAAGAAAFIIISPYLGLKKELDALAEEDYGISAEYSINYLAEEQAHITDIIPERGFIYGEKSEDKLHLMLKEEGSVLLEAYGGPKTECLINLKHMCNILKKALPDDKLNGALSIAYMLMGDVYISLEHTDMVLGTDYSGFLKELGQGGEAKYKVRRVKTPDSIAFKDRPLSEKTFFEIYIEDYDISIIIGINGAKEESREVYASVKSRAAEVELMLGYDIRAAEPIVFPKEDFSDTHAEVLRFLYRLWRLTPDK